MQKKSRKYRFKTFSRNETAGMLSGVELEGSVDTARNKQVMELRYCLADIVILLCFHLPKHNGYELLFDNSFTVIELLLL